MHPYLFILSSTVSYLFTLFHPYISIVIRFIYFFICSLICYVIYWLVTLFIAHHWLFLNCLPLRASDGDSIMPRRVFSNRGYIRDALFIPFWYIGWKPGRKFHSRIRMDGSAVCTKDTTPRTEMGSNCGLAFLPCFLLLG